jgi:hypothetical protein
MLLESIQRDMVQKCFDLSVPLIYGFVHPWLRSEPVEELCLVPAVIGSGGNYGVQESAPATEH